MSSLFRTVSFRLFLLLMVGMLVIFSIHTYLDIRTVSSNLTGLVYENALRTSDLIVRSTRYSMLLNRKEDVHQTIRTLGSEPGYIGISIYNKSGSIMFSTDSLTTGQQVDLHAEACHVCHASGEPLVSLPTANRMRVYETRAGEPALGLISPIRNEAACYDASCHAHSPDQNVLGVLDVKMSLAGVEAKVAHVRERVILSSLLMTLVIAGLSGAFIFQVIRRPIRRLEWAMQTISQGDLDARVEVRSVDEFGGLGAAFNRMASDLKQARHQNETWTNTLEERVQEKTEELQQAQARVIQMEKMASLGKLSASVAHEINNPLFGILTYSKLGLRELDESNADTEKLREYLSVVQRESSRCGDIVRNLLDFARERGGKFEPNQLHTLIEQVLQLLDHHFTLQQVTVQRDFQLEDDGLVCDARQIQEALIAPCVNAVEAMKDGGELTIRTRLGDEPDTIRLELSDTGGGIGQDELERVFEPFYTTKGSQGGLGLGLAVVYGIVRRHHGEVHIKSSDNGTTVIMTLPRIAVQSTSEAPAPDAEQAL